MTGSLKERWVYQVLVTVLLLAGAIPFTVPFGSQIGAVVGMIGVGLGVGIGLATARSRLSALPTLAVAASAHVLLAPWLLPDVTGSLDGVYTVLAATVTVWRDALTLPLPLTAFPGMTVLPWLTGLTCGVLATRFVAAGRLHLAGFVVLGELAVGIAWGDADAPLPAVVGALLTAGVLGLWALAAQRGRRDRVAEVLEDSDSGLATGARRGVARAGVLLAIVVLVVAVAAPAAPSGRTVLRDVFNPPLDLTEYATPLALVRTLETELASTTLMTVSGLPEGARIRIAALDSYDGLSARISQDSDGGAHFQHIGEGTPLVADSDAAGGSAAADTDSADALTVTLTLDGYTYPWVPTVMETLAIAPSGDRAETIRESLFYDTFSSTGLVTARLAADDILTETIAVPATPPDSDLIQLSLADVDLGTVEDVPASVQALAHSLVGSESEPLNQIRILQQALRTGYYSDGTKSPSDPGHGAARLAAMVSADSLVGDDEQYAVLMMLMCRSLGIPARVVMGFEPGTDGDASNVTGEDVSAWVEVAFEQVGWVSFDVTPERDQVPQQQSARKVSNPEPQVLQPPLPQQDPAELPPVYEDDDRDSSEDDRPAGLPTAVIVSLAVVAGIAALLAAILAAKLLRRARRRRRQGVDRALGAWDEVVDRARDLGRNTPGGITRREAAASLSVGFPRADLPRLARAIDAQVFAAGDPSSYDLKQIWESADAIVPVMASDCPRWRRVLARFSPRSLYRPAGRSTRPQPTSRRTGS
ncbi:Transglutaminase-like superfamily protein [Actinomyces ruminicola]|uniref:Transglutaminase-like superfamily protein n=1 Tax=Actinomyces ruminicola TaxID=332524 RepID=A0A1H0EXZ7_9ACTO|nr:transglutaminase-like domain-containing protein [Actinomyces ruminicola]SDN87213.1 Transglutaminase-like superfamily protein [Actinomyces ruminicola]